MVIAAVLALVLVALFVKMQRERPKKDDADLTGANSLYMSSKSTVNALTLGPATGAAISKVADTSVSPAALTKRGDRLWADFRRCIAFDNQYFGNKLLTLGDEQLEDVYAILGVTCPVRSFFGPLRQVGERFASQVAKADDDLVISDVVDFLERVMPDVLVERAIDMCAMLQSGKLNKNDSDQSIYELIDDYAPEENIYLAPQGSCRGLLYDAADRTLHQVDPLYYEPSESLYDDGEEDEYTDVANYALGGRAHNPDYAHGDSAYNPDYAHGDSAYNPDYAHGDSAYNPDYSRGENDPDYTLGHSAAVNHDPIYGVASGEVPHEEKSGAAAPVYDVGSDGANAEPLYGVATDGANTEPLYGVATDGVNAEPLYGVASNGANAEPLYGVASNGVASNDANAEPLYGIASSGTNVETTYGVASSGSGEVLYNSGSGSGEVLYNEGDGEALYNEASSNQLAEGDGEALYNEGDGEALYNEASSNQPAVYELGSNVAHSNVYDHAA
jgi:hypothetical protein